MNAARSPDSRKLRIIHVFRAPLGGLFRHVIDLAAEQAERGHDVGLFYDSEFRGDNVAAALARVKGGLSLGVLGCPIKRDPHVSDLSAMAHLVANVKRIKPNVIHGHGSKGGLYAAWRQFQLSPRNRPSSCLYGDGAAAQPDNGRVLVRKRLYRQAL